MREFKEQFTSLQEIDYMNSLMNSREHYIHSIMKTDDTGTAKVLAITANGTWDSPNGLLYKQEVSIEIAGEAVTVGAFSKGETPPYKIGDEVEYIIGKEYKGMYNAKLKKPSDYQKGTGKGYPTEKEKHPSFALAYANQFSYSAGIEPGDKNDPKVVAAYVTALASEYLTWLNENS